MYLPNSHSIFIVLAISLSSCSNTTQMENKFLFSSEIEEKRIQNQDDNNAEYFAATDYSFVPDFDRMSQINRYDRLDRPQLDYQQLFETHEQKPAVAYISEHSANSEIVILNESHNHPVHRNFATRLLPHLFANGYRYLGVETLQKTEDFISPAYPKRNMGYYSDEPTFAHFLRTAIDLGFTLFPYEAKAGINGAQREIDQAKNITTFMDNYDNGKYFIYCGFDHANEGKMDGWGLAMAGRIKEYTGINPLTINQTYFNDIKPVQHNTPVVLESKDALIYQPFQQCDVYVFHPIYERSNKQISWKKNKNNNWLKVDFLPQEVNYPVFVKVYITEEVNSDRIPYDIIELKDEKEEEWLIVPTNKPYELFIQEIGNTEEKIK